MEYFILRQDKSLSNAIFPKGVLAQKELAEFDDVTTVALPEQSQEEYVDVLEKPRLILSDKIKQLLTQYNDDVVFKTLIFEGKDEVYCLAEAPKIDCLSALCATDKKGTFKNLILERAKLTDKFVFSIEGVKENYLVINLEVAEKLMRQNPWGIALQKVETI